ncbi:hypothetical protein Trco_000119 [Trichoderma cornu-damae]|uniref:Amidoligase enzyme n=1 Tax=Trichoderma cornu-damae TaxID=654480 RepID=A0A9P8TYQ5_9HYPO|nr:hypothetical protein Trco_000119 [Trichoderma cornu-damae]
MRRTLQLPKSPSLATEIQFGVELEFLAPPISLSQASPASPASPDVPSRDRIFHFFASALQQSGLQAAFLLDRDSDGEQNELRARAPKGSIVRTKHNPDMYAMNPLSAAQWLRAGARENPLFRYWLVKAESDVCGHGKHAAWQPTELNSPILRESEANNLFPGLNTALYAVWTAHPARAHVNDGCGLHVHVSPASAEGLTLLQAQRVATLVAVLENGLLFHLCSPVRRRVHHQLATASALAAAKAGPAAAAAAANLPPNIPVGGTMGKAMNLLWSASDLGQVGQMLARHAKVRGARSTALHVKTHVREDDGVGSTLEFRHAQASFSHGFVDNWVRLVLTLCKVAFLPAERYKLVDSWKTLLKLLNDFAPANWHGRSSEQYWVGYLAVQDRL